MNRNATAAALEDVDTATKKKEATIATQDVLIHVTVKRARLEERELVDSDSGRYRTCCTLQNPTLPQGILQPGDPWVYATI